MHIGFTVSQHVEKAPVPHNSCTVVVRLKYTFCCYYHCHYIITSRTDFANVLGIHPARTTKSITAP